MTRQWLAAPEKMCRQHLMGEHAETHMFVAKMEKGYSLDGFYEGSMFFGASYVKNRHDLLVPYIKGHKTPLSVSDELLARYPLEIPTMHDVKKSLIDLLSRCSECYSLHMN